MTKQDNYQTADELQSAEILLVVDEHDNVLGKSKRSEIHASRQWHRQVFVIIVNCKGEMLLQQRSFDRIFDPGKWSLSVSGHVVDNDSYIKSAEKEAKEELGVSLSEFIFLGKLLVYSESGNELCGGPSAIFLSQMNLDPEMIKPQETEVADIGFFKIESIVNAVYHNTPLIYHGKKVEFAQDFIPVLEYYLKTSESRFCISNQSDNKEYE